MATEAGVGPVGDVETLILFDWDDTLFPTSWLLQRGLLERPMPARTPSREERVQLQRMAEHARDTLAMALQIGKVVIVTNGEEGWVEMSCEEFLPSLIDMLQKVDIVSAR